MKTSVLIPFTCLFFFTACRKHPGTAPDPDKIKFYNDNGCRYLFTVQKEQYDSMLPLFFGHDHNGNIKFIVKAFKGATAQNIARLYDGKTNPWNLASFELDEAILTDLYNIDENGFLEYESINTSPKKFYSEKGDRMSGFYGTPWLTGTSIGDSLSARHTYTSTFENWDLEHLIYKNGTKKFEDSFAYRGRLYEHQSRSYFVYFDPSNMHVYDSVWFSNLYIQKRDKSGTMWQSSAITPLLTGASGGTNGHIKGKYIRLIDAEQREPLVAFNWHLRSNNVTVWEPFTGTDLYNLTFDVPANLSKSMDYFYLRGNLYANSMGSNPYLFRVDNKAPVPVPLRMVNIKGMFGSTKGILLAVRNADNGLDIVELNL